MDGSTAQALWRLAQGNPLYLRELILGGLDSGNLACVAGVWRWHGAIVTSPRLTELIEARLGRMDTVMLELLEVLALAEPVDVQLLESLADPLVLAAADRKGLLLMRSSPADPGAAGSSAVCRGDRSARIAVAGTGRVPGADRGGGQRPAAAG